MTNVAAEISFRDAAAEVELLDLGYKKQGAERELEKHGNGEEKRGKRKGLLLLKNNYFS